MDNLSGAAVLTRQTPQYSTGVHSGGLRVDGPDGMLSKTGSAVAAFGFNRGAWGTKGWKQYEIELAIPTEATSVTFGVRLIGSGKVWADDLGLEQAAPLLEGLTPKSRPSHPPGATGPN